MSHADNNGKKWKQSYNRNIRRTNKQLIGGMKPDDDTCLISCPAETTLGNDWCDPTGEPFNWNAGKGHDARRNWKD